MTKNTPTIELYYVTSMGHDQSKAKRNKRMHHFCQISIKFTNIDKLIHIATINTKNGTHTNHYLPIKLNYFKGIQPNLKPTIRVTSTNLPQFVK